MVEGLFFARIYRCYISLESSRSKRFVSVVSCCTCLVSQGQLPQDFRRIFQFVKEDSL